MRSEIAMKLMRSHGFPLYSTAVLPSSIFFWPHSHEGGESIIGSARRSAALPCRRAFGDYKPVASESDLIRRF